MERTGVQTLDELRQACGYWPDEDGPVDNLIDYKDALEDELARTLDTIERVNRSVVVAFVVACVAVAVCVAALVYQELAL